MVEIDDSYLKDNPAPSLIPGALAEVNVSIEVLSILEINEVDSLFVLQFELSLSWYDPRCVSGKIFMV